MPPQRNNIYLIGFSGTGKSRSGRRAARLLGWTFVDTDDLIEKQQGTKIPKIFETQGENRFRDLERHVLAQVAQASGQVVSTGGGVPVSVENRSLMSATGMIVRLAASPATIHDRLTRSMGRRGRALRPLLGGEAPVDRVARILAERETAYSIAQVTIDTEGKTHDQVAREIADAWESLSFSETK
ncbi:MAG: shikimate kinase [Dehalococcoidia bacterium]